MSYDIAGNLVETADPMGNTSQLFYDDSFADGLNNRGTYAYPTKTRSPVLKSWPTGSGGCARWRRRGQRRWLG